MWIKKKKKDDMDEDVLRCVDESIHVAQVTTSVRVYVEFSSDLFYLFIFFITLLC